MQELQNKKEKEKENEDKILIKKIYFCIIILKYLLN